MSDNWATIVESEGAATVIRVKGEIDIETCERLRDVIEPHLGPQQQIVLDLSEVRFVDSSLVNLLVQARGRLTADGGSLVLRNPSRMAHRLLSIFELEGLLEADASAHRDPT